MTAPAEDVNTRQDLLQRLQTADSVWLPREVFETLYLNPERNVAGDLRKKVGAVLTGREFASCIPDRKQS